MEKHIQISAIFMAVLVIMIPVYVSDAYAASVSIQSVSGSNGVERSVRSSDILTVSAQASLGASENVEPSNLKVYFDGSSSFFLFQECNPVGDSDNSFFCTFSRSFSGLSGTHSARVGLFTAGTKNLPGASPSAEASRQFSVDKYGPKIDSFSADPSSTSTGTIEISYSATDYGISSESTEGAGGIDRIEFYLEGYSGSPVETIGGDGLIEAEGSFDFLLSSEGSTRLCARAYDLLGQYRTESSCITISYDSTGPAPQPGTLEIKRMDNGQELLIVGASAVNAEITLIADSDIEDGTAKADFSKITGPGYSSEEPSSSRIINAGEGSFLELKWINIPVKAVAEASCVIGFTAEDNAGNRLSTDIPCSIGEDIEGPSVVEIDTGAYDLASQVHLIPGFENNISVIFEEHGAGLNNSDVFINFVNINQQSRLKAAGCINTEGSKWECIWEKIAPSVKDGEYVITVHGESRDDLGNILGEGHEFVVRVDRTAPVLVGDPVMTVTPGSSGFDIPNDEALPIITGDRLDFVLTFEEDPSSAYADFSDIGGDSKVYPDECEQSDSVYLCRWSAYVSISGPYDASVKFTFIDSSGNPTTITRTVHIDGSIDDETPRYWQIERTGYECSPKLIDRSLVQFMNPKSYCHIKLVPKASHEELVLASFEMEEYPSGCYMVSVDNDNTEASVTDFINDIQVVNNRFNSTDVYLSVTLNGDLNMDSFQFGCNFTAYSMVDGAYTLNPEYIQVRPKLEFYNNPLGTPGDNYAKDVDKAIEEVEQISEWVTTLNEWFNYANRICQLIQMFVTIATILMAVKNILNIISQGYKPVEGAWSGLCSATKVYDKGLLGVLKWTEPFCAFVTCRWSKDALEVIEDNLGETAADIAGGDTYGLSDEFDVKRSIVWSALTLCIPGVVYNADKLRQIRCQYAACLIRDVPRGIDKAMCDANKAMMECKYFWGQIFNLIPFVQIFSNYMGIIEGYLSDPFEFIITVVNLLLNCDEKLCNPSGKTQELICAIAAVGGLIGKTIDDYEQLKEEGWFDAIKDHACNDYEDAKKDFDEKNKQGISHILGDQ